jgi:shikimate kinase
MIAGGRHLVLIGLMGAGKTTVGRLCAARLGRAFIDTDDVAEALAGMPVAEVFSRAGESRFRALERQAVDDVCASPAPLVVSCGGGTVVDDENRRRLAASGFVVWLRASTAVLAGRVADDGRERPLLAGDAPGALERLLALREPLYEGAADVTVDTDDRRPEEVATAVLDAYGAGR